jgi:CheY-like chemotaxis protein
MSPTGQPIYDILVVDDDLAIREMLREALEDAGYRVSDAEHGAQALAFLKKAETLPHVILLDLMMPVMTGWEFHLEQKADPRLASIPVIVLSARPSMQHEAFFMEVEEFIQKPMDMTRLLTTIQHYCEAQADTAELPGA